MGAKENAAKGTVSVHDRKSSCFSGHIRKEDVLSRCRVIGYEYSVDCPKVLTKMQSSVMGFLFGMMRVLQGLVVGMINLQLVKFFFF